MVDAAQMTAKEVLTTRDNLWFDKSTGTVVKWEKDGPRGSSVDLKVGKSCIAVRKAWETNGKRRAAVDCEDSSKVVDLESGESLSSEEELSWTFNGVCIHFLVGEGVVAGKKEEDEQDEQDEEAKGGGGGGEALEAAAGGGNGPRRVVFSESLGDSVVLLHVSSVSMWFCSGLGIVYVLSSQSPERGCSPSPSGILLEKVCTVPGVVGGWGWTDRGGGVLWDGGKKVRWIGEAKCKPRDFKSWVGYGDVESDEEDNFKLGAGVAGAGGEIGRDVNLAFYCRFHEEGKVTDLAGRDDGVVAKLGSGVERAESTSRVDEGEPGKYAVLHDVVGGSDVDFLCSVGKSDWLDTGWHHHSKSGSRRFQTVEMAFKTGSSATLVEREGVWSVSLGRSQDSVVVSSSSGESISSSSLDDILRTDKWNHIAVVLEAVDPTASSSSSSSSTPCSKIAVYLNGKRCMHDQPLALPPYDGTLRTITFGKSLAEPCRVTELRVWACKRNADEIQEMMEECLKEAELKKRKLRVSIKGKAASNVDKGGQLKAIGLKKDGRLRAPSSRALKRTSGLDSARSPGRVSRAQTLKVLSEKDGSGGEKVNAASPRRLASQSVSGLISPAPSSPRRLARLSAPGSGPSAATFSSSIGYKASAALICAPMAPYCKPIAVCGGNKTVVADPKSGGKFSTLPLPGSSAVPGDLVDGKQVSVTDCDENNDLKTLPVWGVGEEYIALFVCLFAYPLDCSFAFFFLVRSLSTRFKHYFFVPISCIPSSSVLMLLQRSAQEAHYLGTRVKEENWRNPTFSSPLAHLSP